MLGVGSKVCSRPFDQPLFEWNNGTIVYRGGSEVRVTVVLVQQRIRDKRVGTDQQVVAGE